MASVKFYFDEMMPRPVAVQLGSRGYSVTMAVDVGMMQKDDITDHLPYATERNLMLVTYDGPFAGRVSSMTNHAGLICWNGALDDYGSLVRRLVEFAESHTSEDVAGHVFWLK